MARNQRRTEALAWLLRRQFSTEALRRHLREWPFFRVERQMPERLRVLLDRLGRKDPRRR
ncbi:hypothetical protein [Mesorhizobium sp. WSM3860]|uniref:hypothetical protein n=1 Tax=Mesorhizobium sp. WSM3860 TaxID=2029403 RepID=UPI00114093E3|nr:hypothetical protein [Mesorhizobium sp. WSM3860]